MSRVATWLSRQLPACEAVWVEVRDGDECLARLSIPRGRSATLEPEIVSAAETVDARTVSVVAVSKDGVDLSAMVLARPGKREQKSPAGLLTAVMRENELLRSRVLEISEQATRAILSENARLAAQNGELLARREQQFLELEGLRSDRLARELAEREATIDSERRDEFWRHIREDIGPAIMRHLGGVAETKAGSALLEVFQSACENAGDELSVLVDKLPASAAATLESAVKQAQAATLLSKKRARGNGAS
jgi:hypothetical protein